MYEGVLYHMPKPCRHHHVIREIAAHNGVGIKGPDLSLIHISEPTRPY